MIELNQLLLGAIAMACGIAGLLFLRFFRTTGDRFFLFFAVSFWIESINRLILGIIVSLPEEVPVLYAIRFLSYALILLAFIDKNWPRKKTQLP